MSNPEPTVVGAVDASPTKRFFIAVLIKDIDLIDAIVELVDNSVDGAKSASEDGSLSQFRIEVDFNADGFSIADNASGISIYAAENYAFRFGRALNAPSVPGSVGEFGVGMKRALFKLGREFEVESSTPSEQFLVSVDVESWQAEGDEAKDWKFPMLEKGGNPNPSSTGTTIRVTKLYPYAVEELSNPATTTRLIKILRQAHEEALGSGLEIIVNKYPLQAQATTLLASGGIQPISYTENLEIDGKSVKVSLIAGIGDRSLADSGWYVYCNGRQIERAEQSERTGWQTAVIEGEKRTPKAHWQYARFRGYLFFESQSPDVLPWNTTKTGLDVEAPAYRRVRVEMNVAMREVLKFLNELDEEGKDGPINSAIDSASHTVLGNISPSRSFIFTANVSPPNQEPKPVSISFKCDPTQYEQVRESLGATSRKEVGEMLFEYYREAEGLDG